MNYLKPLIWSSIAVLALCMPIVASAADANVPVYNPPKRGAPAGRVGGGTRGGGNVFVLSVLAPDHSGFTTSEQPNLYWYISNATSLPIELTVMDSQGIQPILETRLPAPAKGGIQRVRLADYNIIRLAPGAAYRWYVAVVPDADRRSKDILAGGAIERVDVPADLTAKLNNAGKNGEFRLYTEAGLWYDALKAISDQIETAPEDQQLRNQRAALLSQVGLPAINE